MWKRIAKGVGIAVTAVGVDKLYNKIFGINSNENKKSEDEQYSNLHNTIITNIRETVNNNHSQVLNMVYIFAAIFIIIMCIFLGKYYQNKLQKKYNKRFERRVASNNANQDVRIEL